MNAYSLSTSTSVFGQEYSLMMLGSTTMRMEMEMSTIITLCPFIMVLRQKRMADLLEDIGMLQDMLRPEM